MGESYIPLYRKYRPQTFADLIGQEALVKTLSNAIKLDKVAHAYLFTGPRGTGKTSSARIFAKSLNCINGPTTEPCGKCPNCLDMMNGSSLDVIELDAASNNSVEDARNLLEKTQFVPISGNYKIYIIDEVHMLSTAAFNALLKTLEEPPKKLIFILATTEPHKVLETIISRCQRFDFRRIKSEDIFKRLKHISELEKINITDEAIRLIARKSFGGMRDALAMLDQASVLALDGKTIDVPDVLSIIGSLSEDSLFEIVDTLAHKKPDKLLEILNKILQSGNEPSMILKELTQYFRNLLLIKSCDLSDNKDELLEVSNEYVPKLKEQAELFEVVEIAQIIEKLSEYNNNLKNSTNQLLWLEVMLINILYRQDINTIKSLEKRIEKLEEQLSNPQNIIVQKPQESPSQKENFVPVSAPVQHQEQISQEEAPQKPIHEHHQDSQTAEEKLEKQLNSAHTTISGDLKERWKTILTNIESVPSRMLFCNLSKPVEINEDRIVITFKVESFIKQAKETNKIAPLEKAAQKMFGKVPQIILRTPLESDNKIEESPKEIAKELASSEKKTEHSIQIEHNLDENLEKTQQDDKKETNRTQAAPKKEKDLAHASSLFLEEEAKYVVDLFQGKIIN
ncbi:MAG TPA: DNA polymerase III subunit gamma/tau [Candidatus Adamsella sp.]|nr:DNA polymerase III subunit gamma/tau [Candidatus Adamsella sp.]